ncbi:MAG: stage V sporulation protein SpoVM [Clostridia bacterium]|nr:stage V sporulation protein SpoVM [Clostridia bacterium]
MGGYHMKIVVLRSPKVIRGFLRFIFGIKKEEV